MQELRIEILEAVAAKFTAQYAEAKAQIRVYTENPAGIGEHPQIIEEVEKLVRQMQEAKDCMELIQRELIKAAR